MYLFSMIFIVVYLSLFVNHFSLCSMLDLILVCPSWANIGSHVRDSVKHDIHCNSSIPIWNHFYVCSLLNHILECSPYAWGVACEEGIEQDIHPSSSIPHLLIRLVLCLILFLYALHVCVWRQCTRGRVLIKSIRLIQVLVCSLCLIMETHAIEGVKHDFYCGSSSQ